MQPYPPASPAELHIRQARHKLWPAEGTKFSFAGSDQSAGCCRGTQQKKTVEEMGKRLRAELPLDDVLTCYHDDQDDCDCRKPRPGLMTRAAQRYGIDLSRSYLIGDRWRDVDAAPARDARRSGSIVVTRNKLRRRCRMPVWDLCGGGLTGF